MRKEDVTEIVRELLSKTKRRRTICETIREAMDTVYEDVKDLEARDRLTAQLAEILIYAQRMAAKLQEYHDEWSAEFYERNENRAEDAERRGKR